jgi:hypothetical protein
MLRWHLVQDAFDKGSAFTMNLIGQAMFPGFVVQSSFKVRENHVSCLKKCER